MRVGGVRTEAPHDRGDDQRKDAEDEADRHDGSDDCSQLLDAGESGAVGGDVDHCAAPRGAWADVSEEHQCSHRCDAPPAGRGAYSAEPTLMRKLSHATPAPAATAVATLTESPTVARLAVW